VVFNPNTHKYVLWYNWYPKLWNGQSGVATSDTPVGPFKIVNSNAHLSRLHPADGSLFVDDDGTGYFIYTAIDEGYAVRVERLTPDYLGGTGETSGILAKDGEAPLLFRRNNLYYALCGPLCPACPGGSPVQVLTGTSPLGPFIRRPNINGSPENDTPNIPAQETWVARIPTSEGPMFIWMADRWRSSPDGVNGHDFQFWVMLMFSPDSDILPISYVGRCQISWSQKN
jgi:beta-xylosidase